MVKWNMGNSCDRGNVTIICNKYAATDSSDCWMRKIGKNNANP